MHTFLCRLLLLANAIFYAEHIRITQTISASNMAEVLELHEGEDDFEVDEEGDRT